jgi:hypothetical protein
MNFRRSEKRFYAVSECGKYEMRAALNLKKRPYYNVWHIPSGAHVSAGYILDDVKAACDAHAAKLEGK